MAGEATETVETVKVLDLTKGEFVEIPKDKTNFTNPPLEKFNNEPDPEPEKPEEGKETPKPEEVKPEGDGKKPEETTKKDETKTFEPGSYLSEKWGKYGVKGEEDVEKAFTERNDLSQKNTALQAELEKVKNEPKYRTDQEKKIAEFLQPYDPSKFGEGLSTIAELMSMDPANISQKRALEEAFILKHPDLSREESKELFNEEYGPKFNLNRDDFDSDEAYQKKKRLIEITLKNEEANARRELSQKKESLKAVEKPAEEKKETKTDDRPELPKETIDGYHKQIDAFLKPDEKRVIDRINYLSDDGKELLASTVFSKEQQENIRNVMRQYVQNPASYGDDGKITNFDAQELHKSVARMIYGDFMEDSLLKQVKAIASKLKAEQIAGIDPDKKSSGEGEAKLGIDDQFRQLAAKEKEKREGRR